MVFWSISDNMYINILVLQLCQELKLEKIGTGAADKVRQPNEQTY